MHDVRHYTDRFEATVEEMFQKLVYPCLRIFNTTNITLKKLRVETSRFFLYSYVLHDCDIDHCYVSLDTNLWHAYTIHK